jgi:hypothetical protein
MDMAQAAKTTKQEKTASKTTRRIKVAKKSAARRALQVTTRVKKRTAKAQEEYNPEMVEKILKAAKGPFKTFNTKEAFLAHIEKIAGKARETAAQN